jgi:ABC-2 type transport system permease protein
MTQAIWVLVRARLQILRNTFWRGSAGTKFGTVALIALAAVGAFLLYGFTGFVVRGLRSPELAELLREAAEQTPGLPTDPAALLAALPSAVLLGALALLVFTSFSSLLNSLFLSGDIDSLLVAPVPMRAVFVVKFFGGLSSQYLLLFLLLGAVLLGYGQGMGYGPLYQLSALLALLLIPLLPAGIAALLVMAVVRVLPARRAREIVSILGGLVGVSFYIVTQLASQIGPRVVNPGNVSVLLATDLPLLPSAWAGRALVAAGEGQMLPFLAYGGLFLAMSVLVFAVCLVVAERLYYAGWSNLAGESGRVRRSKANDQRLTEARRGARARLLDPLLALLPRPSRAIVAKDLRLFARDLRNLQTVIFPLALAGIWTYQLFSGGQGPESDRLPEWAVQMQNLSAAGIAFFICLSLSSALAGTGVSREGKGYWLIKLAPLSPMHFLLAKFTLAFLPFPLIGTLFIAVFGLVRGLPPTAMLQQWALLLLGGLGCAAFGMGLGAAFPRLDWENPSQQSSWQSGCFGALFYPIFLVLLVGLVIGGDAVGSLVGGGAAGFGVGLLGWLLALGLTAGVLWLSVAIGTRGLERIEV